MRRKLGRRRGRGRFGWRVWTWWNAVADARKNLPAPDASALGETEREIQAAVNATIRGTEQRYDRARASLESRLAELQALYAEIYEPEYRRLSEKLGRTQPHIYISRPAHLLLFTLFALGEGVFNMVAFNVFGEAQAFTILMALTVALGIPFCAHVIGVWLRQWPPPWWRTLIYTASTVAVLVAVLHSLNDVRFAYLERIDPEFTQAHPELDTAFFAINVLVLVAAALVTYLAYDPEPGFAEAHRRLEQSRHEIENLKGELQELADTHRAEAQMTRQAGLGLIAYYRRVNRRRRSEVPGYFDGEETRHHVPEFASTRRLEQVTDSRPRGAVQTEAAAA